MTVPRPASPAISFTVLMTCVTVVVCFVVAACTAIFLAVPDGANTFSLVAILLATVPSTIASLVGLVKLSGVAEQVTDVATDTHELTNGLGQAKLRAAVAEVVHPDLIDPAALPQLAADKARSLMPEDHT